MAWELTYGTYNYPPMQTRTSVAVIYCRVKRERRCRNTEEMGPRRRPRKWGERGKEEVCRSEEFHTMGTEIESWKILHLFIHSSSANRYLFLIRDVRGMIGVFPRSHWGIGRRTPWTGHQDNRTVEGPPTRRPCSPCHSKLGIIEW